MSTPKRHILFLGLDGADLTYMRPWLDDGTLPHFAALARRGVTMPLESTLTNFTSVAWPVLFTGKNPGKTGVTDITLRVSGTHDIVPSTLSGVKTEPFWVYLGEQGLRTLVINVPMTHPPRPLDGVMVTGFDTPLNTPDFAWPEAVREQLAREGYAEDIIGVQHHLAMSATQFGKVSADEYLRSLRELTQRQTECAERLLAEEAWDVAFVGYNGLDFINHYTTDSAFHRQVYEMADEMVGRLVASAGDETTVIIASDHGSVQCKQCISLSRVLEDAGLIAFQPKIAADVLPWVLSAILPGSSSAVSSWLAERVWKRLPEWVQRLLSWAPLKMFPGWARYYSSIDWTRTRAYVTSSAKTVYVNRADVLPGGIVEPGPAYEKLRDEIIEQIEAIRDPATGSPVFRVTRTEEVWHGPYIDAAAPDLILSLIEERYVLQQSDARGRAFWDADAAAGIGGVHRLNGVLMLAGAGIRRDAALPDAELADVVPTLLYLMGVPLPLELDGQLVKAAIEPAFLEHHPIEMADHARPETYQPPAADYSEEDLESVMEKLRGLGYLE